MKLIHVIPISRGFGSETLSYFSSKIIPEGSLVSVPLRKKEVPAIVIGSEDVLSAKTKLKNADFNVKKISSQKPIMLLSPESVRAARSAAQYFASNAGNILYAIIPKAILDNVQKIELPPPVSRKNKATANEKLVLQLPQSERFTMYKSLIREEFARKASVFFCVPTIGEAESAEEELSKGIEHRTIVLHSSLSKKEMLARWQKALSDELPVLIICTGMFLSLPRHDISTIIIERENTENYIQPVRPYLDFRVFAEFLAKEAHVRIIFSGLPIRVETLWRFKQGELEECAPLKLRLPSSAHQEIVDMRKKEKSAKISKSSDSFEILSTKVKNIILDLEKTKGRLFLFTARRGLSPTTVCNDCSNTVTCEQCGSSIILHKVRDKNIFMCHACGLWRSAKERCVKCRSWKLTALGIGIQKVEEELKKLKQEKVITIDRDSIKTHKQAQIAIKQFYGSTGTILLGTEMVIPYLREQIDHTAIVSIDSLLALPNWRVGERIFSLLLSLRTLSKENFFIQTRSPEYPVLEYALNGNLTDFYKDEMKDREEFNYPPLSTIIKCSVVGNPARISKEIGKLETIFKDYNLHRYPSPTRYGKGQYQMNGLMRIPRDTWPDEKLLGLLYSLPPHISIQINPEKLL